MPGASAIQLVLDNNECVQPSGNPATYAPFAIAAQTQIAPFFASGGVTAIDPDGAGLIFEMPVALPLPKGPNFLP